MLQCQFMSYADVLNQEKTETLILTSFLQITKIGSWIDFLLQQNNKKKKFFF